MEIFIENGSLISKEKWEQKIDLIRHEVKANIENDRKNNIGYEELKNNLKHKIIESVKNRMPGKEFGIFFSGGVDSTTIAFICKSLNGNFTCYNVGFKDGDMKEAPDFIEARKVAEKLSFPLVAKSYNIEEAEKIIREVVNILAKPKELAADYVVKVGVASVVVAAKKIAKQNIFFSGLGSEEIFAGYQRHAESEDINEECWNGLKKMWSRDLERDCRIASYLGISILTPFLDRDVIIAAMRINSENKINENHKKVILREISEEIGVDKEFAWRKKQGAQYGSKFDKALERLAKKYNQKYKKDYLLNLNKI